MDLQPLVPHPDFPPPAGVSVSAAWEKRGSDGLAIAYHVTDPGARILWPPPATGRTDNLWQHTCFEAFIGAEETTAYAEFNFAPSGALAAYAFSDYRTGMRNLDLATPPAIAATAPGPWRATLDVTALHALIGPPPWRLAITAVIEAKDGTKSYWSLAHAPGAPDFHHGDVFAAVLGI
jgi:hypothetical protein